MKQICGPQQYGISSLCSSNDGSLLLISTLGGVVQIYKRDIGSSSSSAVLVGELKGHQDAVNHVIFVPEVNCCLNMASGDSGSQDILSCGDDKTIRLWKRDVENNTSNTPQYTYRCCNVSTEGIRDNINRICLSPARDRVACACDDGFVVILSFPELQLVDRFMASADDPINDIIVLPHGLGYITASEDSAVRVWRAVPVKDVEERDNIEAASDDSEKENDELPGNEGRLVISFDEFDKAVNHLLYIPDRNLIFMACAEHIFGTTLHFTVESLHINNNAPNNINEVLPLISSEVEDDDAAGAAGQFSSANNGKEATVPHLASSSGPTTHYIKSAVFGEENYAYGGHEDYVRGIEFFEVPNLGEQSTDISKEICSSITNCRLVSVSDDSSIIQWSVVSGEVLCRIPKAHDEMIMASALVPVSCGGTSLLCTGSEDGSARLWCLPLSV
eukprot:Tbor_TRINITY_DN5412_c0_g2::TRINITY_DN5412_c0_g2_i3::g.25011::m.25011